MRCTHAALPIRSRSGKADQLVGGVYGVTLGAAFFGESMFSRRTDASKVALAWLVHRLRAGGFTPVRHPVPDAASGQPWRGRDHRAPTTTAAGRSAGSRRATFDPPGYSPSDAATSAVLRAAQAAPRRHSADGPARDSAGLRGEHPAAEKHRLGRHLSMIVRWA